MYKDYKESTEEREAKGFIINWWKFGLTMVVLTLIVIGILNAMGKFGSAAVNTAVFQNSYQKKSADSAADRKYKAQLAEINHQLHRADITDEHRENLEAQAASIRVLRNGR